MATKKNQCVFAPFIKDERSKLYDDLMNKLGQERPFVNLVYTIYDATGAPDAMDAAGYERNSQGQHSADDVYNFLGVEQMVNERAISVASDSRALGITDISGMPVNFNMDDAFRIATEINERRKGRVAYVIQSGNNFQVMLEDKDSRTQIRAGELKEQIAAMDALTDGLEGIGIDTDALKAEFPDIFNPLRAGDFLNYLASLGYVKPSDLTERDIKLLFMTSPNVPMVQAMLNRGWGDMDETIHKMWEVLQDPLSYNQTTNDLVSNTLDAAKYGNKVAFRTLNNDIRSNLLPHIHSTSEEFITQRKLEELHKKYGIDSKIIIRKSSEIKKLSDAVAEAIVALNRQMAALEEKGKTEEGKELQKTLDTLMTELEGKHYTSGLLVFLNKALGYGGQINTLLRSVPNNGTNIEYARSRSEAYARAKGYYDCYYPIVKALANLNLIVVDESVRNADKEQLQSVAKQVLEELDKAENLLNELRRETMIDICREVFGDKPINGVPIATFVEMARQDSSMMDFLYSVARVSNPLIAAMGTIIRDAQTTRDGALRQYAERLRKAQADLGENTEFMFTLIGKQWYILSPYDWEKFNKARGKEWFHNKVELGLTGFALKDAMDRWDERNMRDEVVDATTGRTERVPNSNYLLEENPLDDLTDKQRKYYDTVMQIKGELGSYLPAYAQKQYLPPQRRATWVDIVRKGIKGQMTGKQVALNILDRLNPIKIREDDTRFAQNSIHLDSEEYINVSGSYDNTILRRIPVYYMNALDNPNDMMLDFTSALSGLAATALNYYAMHEVRDMVELMKDYIDNQTIIDRKSGNVLAEVVKNSSVAVAKLLRSKGEASNTHALLEGFVEQHLYGITMKDTGTVARILQALINYTSMRQLTVNVKGAMSNALVGEAQMLIEAVGGTINNAFGRGTMYNVADYGRAHLILAGSKVTPGVWSDHLTGNRTSKAMLLEEMFDPLQEVYNELGSRRFSMYSRLHGGINTMGLYGAGEALIHIVNMYAMLCHEKVLMNGKRVSVYDAIEVANKESKNAYLKLKDGVTRLDGSPLKLDDDFFFSLKKRIRYINQQTHGSMNTEDKGLIQRRIAGRAVMNFRQWMVEHYSRRYRGRHWDGTINDFTEGYWNTMGKMLQSYLSDYLGFVQNANAHWDELDNNQKDNINRALAEVAIFAGLLLLSLALGDPSDHKREWWYRMWIYQVKRLILDERASLPHGIPMEARTIIQAPVASVNTVNGLLYPFIGLANGDMWDTIQSGRYEGWNKYGRNLLKYTVPFYGQIDQLMHMGEEDYIYSIFNQQKSF